MFAVLVRFPEAGGPDREQAAKVAATARGMFEGMPGLRTKAFTYDQAAGRATNIYLWRSEDAARAFFTDELRDRVTELYGSTPTIEFLEILELVDNPAE
jgi:heme-degrading monooxygenase HmoA